MEYHSRVSFLVITLKFVYFPTSRRCNFVYLVITCKMQFFLADNEWYNWFSNDETNQFLLPFDDSSRFHCLILADGIIFFSFSSPFDRRDLSTSLIELST